MAAVWKLTVAAVGQRRARVALTVLAIALSVSLVVAVTSGYASAEKAIDRYFADYVGSTDVEMRKTREHDAGRIAQAVVDELHRDPDVKLVTGRLEVDAPIYDGEGKPVVGRETSMCTIIGAKLPDDVEVATRKMEAGTNGRWFNGGENDAAVVDQQAMVTYNAPVGGYITLPGEATSGRKAVKLKVVGVVHKPAIIAAMKHTIYVPLETLQEWLGAKNEVNRIRIELKGGRNIDAFVARWKVELEKIDPYVKVTSTQESRKDINKQLRQFEALSYLGGAVSMVAAMFIVFSTLSMGVAERQRSLAMLRAVGAQKNQIARLVIVEGMILAGLGAALGVPMGLFWVKVLTVWKWRFFQAGMGISWGGIVFGAGGSILTALAASVLPAWNASKVDVVEALTVMGTPQSSRTPIWAGLAGLALIGVDPFLIFSPKVSTNFSFYAHFLLGLPCLMLGYFLLAPAFVVMVEVTFGRIVAAMLRVRYALVSQELSARIWRSAGTAAALMVGLAILVVMQTQGRTLLSGWKLPTRFPDMFIFARTALTKDQITKLDDVEGIKKGDVLPIGISVAGLPPGYLSIAVAAAIPDATMILAVDPGKALRMMELEFKEGTAADAQKKMESGRYVLVTNEFKQLKGIGVGSKIKLISRGLRTRDHEYEVAGVVWSPGIDVFVSMFDTGRQFEERSAASMFISLENGEKDFGINSYTLIAANLVGGIDKKVLEKNVHKKLGEMGLISGDVRQIKYEIEQGFKKLITVLSSVALSAIAVAALGVANTIMSSIRSRRWQLGVLRSIGVTRGQMMRLILAEAVLIGLVGSALGVVAGLEMAVDANGESGRYIGYSPAIVVPWGIVAFGVLVIMCVAVGASLWPAGWAAREEPLGLLQGGRAGV
jgi:putative ABC transport system permease protein